MGWKTEMQKSGMKQLRKEGKIGPHGGIRYQKKLKAYRVDKRIPRGTTVTVDKDLGEVREITTLKSQDFTEETRNIPKKKGEDFVVVWQYDAIKIKRCISTGKYYVYYGHYPHDKFVCEIHLGAMYDMADVIFRDLGAITRTILKDGRGHPYVRITVRSKGYWREAMKREGRL